MIGSSVALSLLVALAAPIAAQAAIPSGNLLKNPGAEEGPASADGNGSFTPPGWTPGPYSPRALAVRYGAPQFPTVAQADALGGGRNFFAGGPSASGDNNDFIWKTASLRQTVAFSVETQSSIDAGGVQATLSGCLGGYADQNDSSSITGLFLDGGGNDMTPRMEVVGPDAATRGNRTTLIAALSTVSVPVGAKKLSVSLDFGRTSGKGSYNDGYADNASLNLSPAGSPAPGANCGPQGGGGGGGGGSNSGRGGGSSLLGRVGRSATLSRGSIVLRLRCLGHEACKGSLSLSVPKLPAVARRLKLGKARFSIPAGKTGRVKVKLSRRVRKRLERLSKRRLRRVKVTVNTRVGTVSSKFLLRLRR
jgi:hypothetical protein